MKRGKAIARTGLTRWRERDASELDRSRTDGSFCVPKADIGANDYLVSVLLDQGTPVNVVADLVGHESAVTTWRVYGHLIDGTEDRARSAVEAAWGTGDH